LQKKHANGNIGVSHLVTKEESIKWYQQKYDGIVLNK